MTKLNRKIKVASVTGSAALAIAIIIWLFISGRVMIVWAGSGNAPVVAPRVCGNDIIAEYNNSFAADSTELYKKRLSEVGNRVEDTANAESDPNCQVILFNYYYDNEQYDKAKRPFDITKTLAAQGRYATTELEMVQSVATMQSLLDTVNASEEEGRG